MKLTDLKEWGGRDLPGFGDEATWGGRSPDGGGDRASLQDYLSSDYTNTSELDNECFFIDPGEFGPHDDEVELKKIFKNLGITVENDTGHPLPVAFTHAFKPVWNFCCNGPDRWIAKEHIPALQQLCTSVGPTFTVTQIRALSKQWLNIAESGPTTIDEIRDALND